MTSLAVLGMRFYNFVTFANLLLKHRLVIYFIYLGKVKNGHAHGMGFTNAELFQF